YVCREHSWMKDCPATRTGSCISEALTMTVRTLYKTHLSIPASLAPFLVGSPDQKWGGHQPAPLTGRSICFTPAWHQHQQQQSCGTLNWRSQTSLPSALHRSHSKGSSTLPDIPFCCRPLHLLWCPRS